MLTTPHAVMLTRDLQKFVLWGLLWTWKQYPSEKIGGKKS
jgi:hypothetical protein